MSFVWPRALAVLPR